MKDSSRTSSENRGYPFPCFPYSEEKKKSRNRKNPDSCNKNATLFFPRQESRNNYRPNDIKPYIINEIIASVKLMFNNSRDRKKIYLMHFFFLNENTELIDFAAVNLLR